MQVQHLVAAFIPPNCEIGIPLNMPKIKHLGTALDFGRFYANSTFRHSLIIAITRIGTWLPSVLPGQCPGRCGDDMGFDYANMSASC